MSPRRNARQSTRLSKKQLRQRAARVALVLTDSDGVLTDTGVYYGADGETMKRFSIRDGMGIERLRAAGIETAILTGELSPSVRRRAEKLQMRFLYVGIKDKSAHLKVICQETGFSLEQLAFIGDDMNDLEIIRKLTPVSLTGAPADAIPAIAREATYRCRERGGYGAFREFAEWILELQVK
jgi:3-deoxy-D-manno-octulosonate 8-phosphate phosphatase (KDO 8-P phosphatase)